VESHASIARVRVALYALRSENLTGLGGPMGTETTWTNWTRYFFVALNAKLAASKDLINSGRKERILWSPTKEGWRSQDLRNVMYHVTLIVAED